jgi:hypothetical protein
MYLLQTANIDREDVCDMTLTEDDVKAFDIAIDQQVCGCCHLDYFLYEK